MIKRDYVKKKLIAEGIVAGAIAGGAAVLMSMVMAYSASLSDDVTDKRNEFFSITNNNMQISNELKTNTDALERYKKLFSESGKKNFGLDRKEALALLDKLAERHRMLVTAEFEKLEEINDERFKKKTTIPTVVKGKISFKAITDEYAFSFLNDVSREFQGNVQFLEINITRVGNVSKETLVSVGQGKNPSLVDGYATFNWLGLKDKPKEGTAAANPAANPNAAPGMAPPIPGQPLPPGAN